MYTSSVLFGSLVLFFHQYIAFYRLKKKDTFLRVETNANTGSVLEITTIGCIYITHQTKTWKEAKPYLALPLES